MGENLELFNDLPTAPKEEVFSRLLRPVWTENKAAFIARYLSLFVMITKHGTYIDGFAGPQRRDLTEAWSARLVLHNEPHWFRHFHLCEISRRSMRMLRSMISDIPKLDSRGRPIKKNIRTYHGDFNAVIDQVLTPPIEGREATFCLLDQRTFECHWATVQKLATHKPAPSQKIELFYFLAVGWLHRSLSGVKSDRAERWWGRADWRVLRSLSQEGIVNAFIDRFQKELGYKHVKAFPIFAREDGDQVMYHMIHASDHDEAPRLMIRAYNSVMRRPLKDIQEGFVFDESTLLEIR